MERKADLWIYGWIIGGLAALDLGLRAWWKVRRTRRFKGTCRLPEDFIKLHKNHNSGFPFRIYEGKTGIGKGFPLMVDFGHGRALAATMQDKGKTGEKLGLSLCRWGALSNLYDRVVRGYVVGLFHH